MISSVHFRLTFSYAIVDQSRKGVDRPVIPNSETAAVLESLESLF